MRTAGAVAIAALLLVAGSATAWSRHVIGSDGPITDLAVADGDGDGAKEVYAVSWDNVVQWRWNGAGWTKTVLHVSGGESIAVGDADRDGKPEVYAGTHDGFIRQRKWDGEAWRNTVVAVLDTSDLSHAVGTLTIGDAEGDGLRELYAVNWTGNVYKVWFKEGAWHKKLLADLNGTGTASWIGDGDRDGKPELYVGTSEGVVAQVKRVNGVWRTTLLEHRCCSVGGVAVGDTNGDGKREVYAVGEDQIILKYHWNGARWIRTFMDALPTSAWDVAPGDLDRDGRAELYVTGGNTLYRVRWTGSAWSTTALLSTPEAAGQLATLAIGNGDRDGDREVYAGEQVVGTGPSPFGVVHRFQP